MLLVCSVNTPIHDSRFHLLPFAPACPVWIGLWVFTERENERERKKESERERMSHRDRERDRERDKESLLRLAWMFSCETNAQRKVCDFADIFPSVHPAGTVWSCQVIRFLLLCCGIGGAWWGGQHSVDDSTNGGDNLLEKRGGT